MPASSYPHGAFLRLLQHLMASQGVELQCPQWQTSRQCTLYVSILRCYIIRIFNVESLLNELLKLTQFCHDRLFLIYY